VSVYMKSVEGRQMNGENMRSKSTTSGLLLFECPVHQGISTRSIDVKLMNSTATRLLAFYEDSSIHLQYSDVWGAGIESKASSSNVVEWTIRMALHMQLEVLKWFLERERITMTSTFEFRETPTFTALKRKAMSSSPSASDFYK
jgi:hypothetical protein